MTTQVNHSAHREPPGRFVERMIHERGSWEDDPSSNLDWLRDRYSEHYGYRLVDWTRQADREGEEAGIRWYKRYSWKVHRPMIVLRAHAQFCSILVDMDSMERDGGVNWGGLTDAESAAINKLMQPYRKELQGSPIIRQWGRVPYERAHWLAVSIFIIIMGGPPLA